MKFVHAADIHLDSPLRGLDRYEGAPVERFRGATRRALENLVELCLAESVDLMLIAGDLYDGNWKDYKTGLFFAAQMARLRAANVRVFLLRGNHDAESQITRSLKLPDNVHTFDSQQPQTIVMEPLGVALHGQSFAQRAVAHDLADRYPDARPGLFNIGLLHTSLTGREGHDDYAPTTIETLRARGYDYWALGHVHKRELVCDEPYVLYPGNLQGRHARETGEKGATLVTVDNGRIVEVEARPLDVVRWTHCQVDAAGAVELDDVLERVRAGLHEALAAADGRTLAARVTVAGTTRAHAMLASDLERWQSEVRNLANDLSGAAGEGVWVEKIRLETRAPVDAAELAERDDAVGQLVRGLQQLRDDPAELAALLDELKELKTKLPPELRDGPDGIRLDDPALVASLLPDVERLLLPRLVREGGS